VKKTPSVNHGATTANLIRLVAKGSFIVLVGSITGKVLRFILHVILARVLGVASYGLYSLGQSINDISLYIVSLGDGKAIVRFGSVYSSRGDVQRLKGLIFGFLFISLGLSIILVICFFTFSGFIAHGIFKNPALEQVLKIFSMGLPFSIILITTAAIGFAFNKARYKVIIQDIGQTSVNTLLIIGIFFLKGGLKGAIFGYIASLLISSLFGIFLVIKNFPLLVARTPVVFEIRKIIGYSLPIVFIVSSYFLIFEIDRILLGFFLSVKEVGIYTIASSIAMNILVFSSIFVANFSPVITQLYHNNKIMQLKKMYKLVSLWGVWLTFIPCICFIIFYREIISLFGSGFESAKPVLIILSVVFLLESIAIQTRELLQMSGKQNIEVINSIFSIVLNILLNVALIPIFGIVGASIATGFSLLSVSFIRIIEIKNIFGFLAFTPRFIRFLILAACIIIVCIAWLINQGLPVRLLGSVVIISCFVFFYYLFKAKEDVLVWNAFKRRLLSVS